MLPSAGAVTCSETLALSAVLFEPPQAAATKLSIPTATTTKARFPTRRVNICLNRNAVASQESESQMSSREGEDDPYARFYRRREKQRRRRRRKRALSLLGALALLALGGYFAVAALNDDATATGARTAPTQPTQAQYGTREGSVASETAPAGTATPTRPGKGVSTAFLTNADKASFRNLERESWWQKRARRLRDWARPAHSRGSGTLREDVAWSTIKVPIALAIETRAAGQPSPSEQSLLGAGPHRFRQRGGREPVGRPRCAERGGGGGAGHLDQNR